MASPSGSRRLLGGSLLLGGIVLAVGSLLVLAQEVTGDAAEPLTLEMIIAVVAGVLLGLVVMAVGAMLGR